MQLSRLHPYLLEKCPYCNLEENKVYLFICLFNLPEKLCKAGILKYCKATNDTYALKEIGFRWLI
jgi:hypothetical protein